MLFILCLYPIYLRIEPVYKSMAACSTLSNRGRKNASAGGDILEATVQQDKKYDVDQNPTGIISLDNADNVLYLSIVTASCEQSLISKHKYYNYY